MKTRAIIQITAILLISGMAWAQNSKLSQFTQKEPPCGITLSVIEAVEKPVIARGMPGTEHNKYGFEGSCVLKLDGVYHLFTSEMVADPVHDKMMLAHWTSPDGKAWRRRDTMFESSASKDPKEIRSALWAPMPVYNEEEGRGMFFTSPLLPGTLAGSGAPSPAPKAGGESMGHGWMRNVSWKVIPNGRGSPGAIRSFPIP